MAVASAHAHAACAMRNRSHDCRLSLCRAGATTQGWSACYVVICGWAGVAASLPPSPTRTTERTECNDDDHDQQDDEQRIARTVVAATQTPAAAGQEQDDQQDQQQRDHAASAGQPSGAGCA